MTILSTEGSIDHAVSLEKQLKKQIHICHKIIEKQKWECVKKRQQLDQRAEKNRRQPIGPQHSEKITQRKAGFIWPFNKMCTNAVKNDFTLNSKM